MQISQCFCRGYCCCSEWDCPDYKTGGPQPWEGGTLFCLHKAFNNSHKKWYKTNYFWCLFTQSVIMKAIIQKELGIPIVEISDQTAIIDGGDVLFTGKMNIQKLILKKKTLDFLIWQEGNSLLVLAHERTSQAPEDLPLHSPNIHALLSRYLLIFCVDRRFLYLLLPFHV